MYYLLPVPYLLPISMCTYIIIAINNCIYKQHQIRDPIIKNVTIYNLNFQTYHCVIIIFLMIVNIVNVGYRSSTITDFLAQNHT